MITRIQTGSRLSQVAVANGLAFLTGQVSDLPNGTPIFEQTVDVLRKIDELLQLAGTHKSNIVTATVLLTDVSLFSEMNRAWDAWVPKGATPSRSTVGAKLLSEQYAVEIAVVAAVDQ